MIIISSRFPTSCFTTIRNESQIRHQQQKDGINRHFFLQNIWLGKKAENFGRCRNKRKQEIKIKEVAKKESVQ